jgi:hypothetical protein
VKKKYCQENNKRPQKNHHELTNHHRPVNQFKRGQLLTFYEMKSADKKVQSLIMATDLRMALAVN